jgi:hypothetical protein
VACAIRSTAHDLPASPNRRIILQGGTQISTLTCPAQCNSWPGPISAALYVALDYGGGLKGRIQAGTEPGGSSGPDSVLKAALEKAKQFHAMAEKDLHCQVSAAVVPKGSSSLKQGRPE